MLDINGVRMEMKYDDLVNEKIAAEMLGVTAATMQVWRSTARYGIPYIKVGRLVRYRISDLEAWLVSRTRATGATA